MRIYSRASGLAVKLAGGNRAGAVNGQFSGWLTPKDAVPRWVAGPLEKDSSIATLWPWKEGYGGDRS